MQANDAVLEARVGWLRNMPYLALSALIHLLVLLLLLNLVFRKEPEKENEVSLVLSMAPRPEAKPPAYDPKPKRGVFETRKIPLKEPTERPLVRLKPRERHLEPFDDPRGTSLRNLTDVNLVFSASGNETETNRSIGVGPGVAGAYGQRWGKDALLNEGGGPRTEPARRAALEWLRRHQSPDGSWKSAGYTAQCTQKCQSVDAAKYGSGQGLPDFDVGVTGLAMLAFAGTGHTHQTGEYEEYADCLRKAVAYLKQVQVHSDDAATHGRFGGAEHEQWIYNHAIATMALCELYVLTRDVYLKKPVTDAVKLCLRAQNEGRGWRYGIKPGDNDTSVTGWMVLALKTATNARSSLTEDAPLGIPKEEYERAFQGARNWFDFVTASDGRTGYVAPGDAGSRLQTIPEPYPYSKELSCMTAVAVLCRLFAGESRESKTVKAGVDFLMRHTPEWREQKARSLSTINLYHWYYASYALFQYGGAPWKAWNPRMIEALVPTQRKGEICEDGSWDPIDEWGAAGGRIYATALGAMTLEVYYRFRRMEGG